MQDIVRRMWARLTPKEQDDVKNNLEGWQRSAKSPEYKGGILVGEGETVTDENNKQRAFKAGTRYGSKANKL